MRSKSIFTACARSSNRPESISLPCAASATALRNLRKRQNPDVQRSLFGEILDWMLAPLLFVWPISIAFTHYFANSVASFPYDQSCVNTWRRYRARSALSTGGPQLAAPGLAQIFLRSDEIDNVYFHLLGRDGRLIVGDPELPVPTRPDGAAKRSRGREVLFRDDEYRGQTLRVAYLYLRSRGVPPSAGC
jgi:two-component system sensor histidine kinase TctE